MRQNTITSGTVLRIKDGVILDDEEEVKEQPIVEITTVTTKRGET